MLDIFNFFAIISIVCNRVLSFTFLLTTSYVTSTCSTLIFSISLVFEISFFSPGIATSFRNHLLGGRGTRASIMQEPGRLGSRKPPRYTISPLIQHRAESPSWYFAFDRN